MVWAAITEDLAGTGWADRTPRRRMDRLPDLEHASCRIGAGIGGGSATQRPCSGAWTGRALTWMPAVYDACSGPLLSWGDIPFSLVGGLAHCTGIGERIRPRKEMVRPMLLRAALAWIFTTGRFRCWDRAQSGGRRIGSNPARSRRRPTAAAPRMLSAVGRRRPCRVQSVTRLRQWFGRLSAIVVVLLAAAAQTGAVMCRMTGSGQRGVGVYADADAPGTPWRTAAFDFSRRRRLSAGPLNRESDGRRYRLAFAG